MPINSTTSHNRFAGDLAVLKGPQPKELEAPKDVRLTREDLKLDSAVASKVAGMKSEPEAQIAAEPTAKATAAMTPESHIALSNENAALKERLTKLEEKMAAMSPPASTGQQVSSAVDGLPPTSQSKLKKGLLAVRNAFAKVPLKTIGKGVLYSGAAAAGFFVATNPLAVMGIAIGCLGAVLNTPLLIGALGAGAAAWGMHKALSGKGSQHSNQVEHQEDDQHAGNNHPSNHAEHGSTVGSEPEPHYPGNGFPVRPEAHPAAQSETEFGPPPQGYPPRV
ncbi:hypothetical protein QN362_04980 [Actimicrobium sp. CCC2.4]|uniref:hypothetical protein n=1 Tax=Actimicrobium sp. CCC2.4 TaxID=3048606 RepID=UPI002AC9EE47|nr:hypothetical protein [Actimicrobium sp. CCC2.4]MEB0134680.1 hypothetical protein [Actimicrobium sp. CCC2.4]WPX30623.1 hypothetical protein RHM62_10065 [Actimicrobium sp. CCC2.4]